MREDTHKGMKKMLADIVHEVRFTRSMIGKDELDPRVMDAMAKVPRDEFVPRDMRHLAFDNGPLPVGHGQTISQPFIVALMTDMLAPRQEHTILEVGTGTGYQTAVLSELSKRVYSIDVIPELTDSAETRLRRLGYENVEIRCGNGYRGWPEHAPYDGILVTAAASHVPAALIEQLRPGGRLVIPVGQPSMPQELMQLVKNDDGSTTTRRILGVAFVPLVDRETPSSQD